MLLLYIFDNKSELIVTTLLQLLNQVFKLPVPSWKYSKSETPLNISGICVKERQPLKIPKQVPCGLPLVPQLNVGSDVK